MSLETLNPSKPQFREATNLLRGICAFSILVWHYQHFFYAGTNAIDFEEKAQPFFQYLDIFYRFGNLAVPIFWCISGLVITHTHINNSEISARNFLTARVARLYPIHLLTLIVVVILQIISNYKYNEFQIYSENDLYHFVLNLFFIQSWGFGRGYSFNYPTWSVSVEIIVYVIFFLILKKIQKFRIFSALVVWVVCMIINSRSDRVFSKLFFLECLEYFAAGMIIYFVVEKINKQGMGVQKLIINLVIFMSILSARFLDVLVFDTGAKAWSLAMIYFVFIAAQIDGTIFARQFKKIKLFGDLSYSVFLWHIPIQISIKMIFPSSKVSDSYETSNLFFAFYLIVTYLVGYFSFKFIEQPAQRYLRQKLMSSSRIG